MKSALFHSSWKIATIIGIPIRIHVSWIIIFGFLTWSLSSFYFPKAAPDLPTSSYWIEGSIAAILLFSSVAFHELAHSYIAKRYKIPIISITLFIFGGIARMKGEPPTPKSELNMAIAGPISNFILSGLFYLLYKESFNPSITALFSYLFRVNLMLAIFNLFPGFPMDGGRVLRAILWKWKNDYYYATRHASVVGQRTALFFIFFGLFLVFLGGTGGIWFMIIGWFLYSGAHGSYLQANLEENLSGIKVKDVMATDIISVKQSMTIDEAVYGYFLKYAYGGFPVYDNDKFLGVITLKEVRHIYRRDWPDVTVSEVFIEHNKRWEVSPNIDVIKALELMITENKGRLIVKDSGKLVGLITRNGIAKYLQIMKDTQLPLK